MRVHNHGGEKSAFTLIELLISAALMALVLGGAYACLSAGFASQRIIEPRADLLQSARVALNLLSADLRCACPLPKGSEFLGVHRLLGEIPADNLDFATHNYTPRNPGEGDFCEESLFLEPDPRTGRYTLWRRRNPRLAFDPLSGGSREEIASGLLGFRLEYYDGLDWYDSWGDPKAGSTKSQMATSKPNSSGLPEAVRLTLIFDTDTRAKRQTSDSPSSDGRPLMFQTVARINVPSTGRGSSDTSNTSSTSGAGPARF